MLVPGSTSTLVRGFFTEPVASVSTEDFLDNRAGRLRLAQHKTFPAHPVLALRNGSGIDQGIFTQTLNLYDLSAGAVFDVNGSNRFKSLTFKGLNANVSKMNVRVIRLNRAMGGMDASSGSPGLLDEPVTFVRLFLLLEKARN